MIAVQRYLILVTVALLVASWAGAQTVYKSVDEKGNVIYSEKPPTQTKNGKIRATTELPIDPNQNIVPAVKRPTIPAASENEQAVGDEHAQRVTEAQTALDNAEAQLKEGKEIQAGDFIGRAGGGVGPSQQRLQRLDDLQRDVDEARQNLEKVESERP